MKLRFWDRILSALTGLLAILAGAGMILHITGLVSFGMLEGRLQSFGEKTLHLAVIIAGAVLVLLGIHGVGMLFRRRRDKGFVIQRTELGDMSISIKALESMAKRCISVYPDLTVKQTRIYRNRDSISVELKVTMANGINIPLTINALQKQIKQYITSCSGIDVKEVRVKVETDVAKLAAPADVPVIEAAAPVAPVAMESVTEQLNHKEEPAPVQEAPVVAEPAAEPVVETVEETAEEPVCEEIAAEETVEAEPEAETEEVQEAEEEAAAEEVEA